MEHRYDGLISRHLNRRVSDPLARLLARTPLTPNQATLVAGAIGALAFVAFLLGHNVVGGVLAQLSSIADGVDGELARLKGMSSSFGGFLDAVLDRYVDALVLLGMALWSATHETYPSVWLVGFLALTGAMGVSYTRARAPSGQRGAFDRGLASLASRDVRLFLLMLGAVVGQAYISLLALAALTNAVVSYRLLLAYLHREAGGVGEKREAERAAQR